MKDSFENLGFSPADILLPKEADMTKWAGVACDQFRITSVTEIK